MRLVLSTDVAGVDAVGSLTLTLDRHYNSPWGYWVRPWPNATMRTTVVHPFDQTDGDGISVSI